MGIEWDMVSIVCGTQQEGFRRKRGTEEPRGAARLRTSYNIEARAGRGKR